ncbi:GNAT family N-acetyltransferase [Desulfitobacterium hafniense]|uniref:GNAT family N-acetyltransferase n=1 Tax=Desulfitobacterium hafniense TaxID=49338 RepID=UPI00036E7B08|nr:GNAT family N-acetyltransferase [Desulfitobacterium hafniense]
MEFKRVTLDNLASEHICCALTDQKGESSVASKKAWLSQRLAEGLVFDKLDVRGKVFIEYIPAEKAWCPITADHYLFINCFWVSGQYKGQGYANLLLERCLADAKAKGKQGLVVLSAEKKMPFLSDPKYLKYKGFQIADQAPPYYELLYLPFSPQANVPQFKACVKSGRTDEEGWVVYYTNQCPHTDKYVPILVDHLKSKKLAIKAIKIETTEQAQKAPNPFTTYALFYNGQFITNEILTAKSFDKLLIKTNLSPPTVPPSPSEYPAPLQRG